MLSTLVTCVFLCNIRPGWGIGMYVTAHVCLYELKLLLGGFVITIPRLLTHHVEDMASCRSPA